MQEFIGNGKDYDIHIMNENIKEIMKQKSITQEYLAEHTNMTQPRISECLGSDDTYRFTIPQLVAIAQVLGESVDSILGTKSIEKSNSDLTLSDVFAHLFEIDKLANINIKPCINEGFDEETGETYEYDVTGICFDIPCITEMLEEWGKIKSALASDPETKEILLPIWETQIQEKAQERKAKWNFRSSLEQGELIAQKIAGYSDYDFSTDTDTALEYINSLSYDDKISFRDYMDTGEAHKLGSVFNNDEQESLNYAYEIISKSLWESVFDSLGSDTTSDTTTNK